jgi:hypothetical protein
MKNFICSTFLSLFFITIANGQSTDQPRNEFEVRGQYSIPSGETRFSTTGNTGSTISFGDDFDFGNELGYGIRFSHRNATGKHKLLAEFTDESWDRNRTLTRSFTFLGQTYIANLDTHSALRLRTFRAMYSYRWGNEKIRVGPMVDMGVVSTRLELTGVTNNGIRTTEGKINKFAATVGYDLDWYPVPKVHFFNNLGAIKFRRDHLFHVEGGVKYFPARHFGVSGGYRFQRYKLEDNDNFLTVRSNGPFAGGIVRF